MGFEQTGAALLVEGVDLEVEARAVDVGDDEVDALGGGAPAGAVEGQGLAATEEEVAGGSGGGFAGDVLDVAVLDAHLGQGGHALALGEGEVDEVAVAFGEGHGGVVPGAVARVVAGFALTQELWFVFLCQGSLLWGRILSITGAILTDFPDPRRPPERLRHTKRPPGNNQDG